jgi:hypothetical protein
MVILCAKPKRPLLLRLCPPYFSTKLKTRVNEVMIIKKPYLYVKVKVKVTFTLEQATKAQRGSRGIALLFL